MKNNKLEKQDKKYWRSREELISSSFFSDSQKKEGAEPSPLKEESGASRREFLKIMGAGMALAGSSCMRRPTEKIVPYVDRPEEIIPGKALYYASSFYDGGEGFSTLVKTREGRPIKMEGNEQAELLNGSALSPRAEACLLSLYDPERAKGPMQNLFNEEKTNKESIRANWTEMDKSLTQAFKKGQTAILSPRIPSPSSQALIKTFCSVFQAKAYVWEPLSHESFIEGQKLCYKKALLPSYNIHRARFILSLNCDFLGTWLSPVEFQRQFAKGRRPETGEMNRLVVLESLMSLTGSNADERFRIGLQDQLPALCALTKALHKKGTLTLPKSLKSLIKSHEKTKLKIPDSKWNEWADELIKHKGQSLILFGGIRGQTKQALETHILVNFLNSALQNDGRTINYRQSYPYDFGSYSNMAHLIDGLEKGAIKHLIIHGVNPLYSYPDSARLKEALKKADLVVYTGDRMDETASWSHFLVPDSHPLEKWSDWEFKKDLFSIQQPAIRPLYNTRAFEDSLIHWIKLSGSSQISSNNFYEYIKSRWEKRETGGANSSSSWENFLKKGLSGQEESLTSPPRPFNTQALKQIKTLKKREGGEVFLSLYESSGIRQGDMSNNAWLMEFPDPVSKICWENYLSISPALALKKQLKEGDVVALASAETSILAPVHIQPGQEDRVLGLAIGYGRQKAGSVGNNKGVNAFPLIETNGGKPNRTDKKMGRGGFVSAGKALLIEKTPHFVPLANVQGHHSMEGRDIILETTLQEFKKDPSSGLPHHHKVPSLWSKHKYKGHKWGMVIDLNSCTGCGTCMIACQSENNIPTVGKKHVLQGREMHWIRVDRYYKGPEENPEALHQPVVCMHCDNAPCETVCPVLATVHSDEGTNDMVYNRCVGTRYCSNNCPYKVRRFNWFDYTKQSKEEPLKLALNPDVTVRHRGVMEKCSFCIQKIHEGKAQAKREGRELKDGDIKTACQQSCPSDAIVFGDLNNPESKVSKAFQAKNSYALLDNMLNTKPAVKYLTKVRNKAAKSSSNKGGGKSSSHH